MYHVPIAIDAEGHRGSERLQWGPAYADPTDENCTPYNLVFTREDGAPLDPNATYKTFVRLVAATGLPYLKFHRQRLLNISLQLDAGVTETVIAMRVGHTSPTLIRKTYGHLIGTVGHRAAEATAALVPLKKKSRRRRKAADSRGAATLARVG